MKTEIVKRLWTEVLRAAFNSLRPSAVNQLHEQYIRFADIRDSAINPIHWNAVKSMKKNGDIRRLHRRQGMQNDQMSRATFGLNHKGKGEFEPEIRLDPGNWPIQMTDAIMDVISVHKFQMVKGGEIVMTRASMLDTPKPQNFGAWT